jgi:hypothetical protein
MVTEQGKYSVKAASLADKQPIIYGAALPQMISRQMDFMK